MKQIVQIKLLLAIIVLFGSLAVLPGGIVMPNKASAAGCQVDAFTPSEQQAQADCVSGYMTTCKRTYDKAFCAQLSIEDINSCAAAGTAKFKPQCMQDLLSAYKAGPQTPTTSIQPKVDDCNSANPGQLNKDNCGIIGMIVVITNILAGIAGLVIVSTLIWGGILYSMSAADPAKVQAAKSKIKSSMIALFLLIFGYAFLQWMVPGGLF